MVFQCINIPQVSWEVLKTAAFGLGLQHLPRDLANVNAWKIMFDPYNKCLEVDTQCYVSGTLWRCVRLSFSITFILESYFKYKTDI